METEIEQAARQNDQCRGTGRWRLQLRSENPSSMQDSSVDNYKPPKARAMGPQGTTPIFEEFCEETSAHVFFQVGDSGRHWWARFMWLIILILFTGAFGLQFEMLVEKYCRFEVTVNTNVETVKKMPFPTISVCNINPYQNSKIPNNTRLYEYLNLVQALLTKPDDCQMTTDCEKASDSLTKKFCTMMGSMNPKCRSPAFSPPPPSLDVKVGGLASVQLNENGTNVNADILGLAKVDLGLGVTGTDTGVDLGVADVKAQIDATAMNLGVSLGPLGVQVQADATKGLSVDLGLVKVQLPPLRSPTQNEAAATRKKRAKGLEPVQQHILSQPQIAGLVAQTVAAIMSTVAPNIAVGSLEKVTSVPLESAGNIGANAYSPGSLSNDASLTNVHQSQIGAAITMEQAMASAVTEAVRVLQTSIPSLSDDTGNLVGTLEDSQKQLRNALATASPELLSSVTSIIVESLQNAWSLPGAIGEDKQLAVNGVTKAARVHESDKPFLSDPQKNNVTGTLDAVESLVQNAVAKLSKALAQAIGTQPPTAPNRAKRQVPPQLPSGNAPNAGDPGQFNVSNMTVQPEDMALNVTNTTNKQGGPAGSDPRMSLLSLESVAEKIIGTLGEMESSILLDAATQPLDDLVQDCRFNMGNCSMDTATSKWPNPWYGACYSFNRDGASESVRPGPLYGLAMQLHVNKNEYLKNIFTVGVRIGVNEPNTMPFPEIDGIFAPVGGSTAVGISVIENQRKGSPYTQCLDSTSVIGTDAYYYNGTYTPFGCQNTCLQREIVKKCKCWHFAYPKPPENDTFQFTNDLGPNCSNPDPKKQCTPLCSFDQISDCASELEMSTNIDCTCYQTCTDRKYQLTVTKSLWPTHAPPNCPPGGSKCNLSNTDTYAKENQLKLLVYYESMTKFVYTEAAAYNLLSLISDFGGQLGLWIGASFCTMIEIISLLISLIVSCCGHPHSIEKKIKNRNNMADRKIGGSFSKIQPRVLY